MLFRKYALEANETFTQDDVLLIEAIHMTYSVEDYMRSYLVAKINTITKYSDLKTMSFDVLAKRVSKMLMTERRMWTNA